MPQPDPVVEDDDVIIGTLPTEEEETVLPPTQVEEDPFAGLRSGYGPIVEPMQSDWTGTGNLFEQNYVKPLLTPEQWKAHVNRNRQAMGGRVKMLKGGVSLKKRDLLG